MKKISALILACTVAGAALAFTACGSNSDNGTKGLEYTLLDDGTYCCSGIGTATGKEITIASTYNGKTVTAIGESAFEDCTAIEKVTIPATIEEMGVSAFSECTSLKGVYISDLTAWCNIYFDENSSPLEYAHNLYLNGELLTQLTIPEGVQEICEGAFSDCTPLQSVTFPDGFKTIGRWAFSTCTSLEKVTIPASVEKIDYMAFINCTSLNSVYISDLKAWCSIEFGSYKSNPLDNGCKLYVNDELLTELVIPQGITAISDSAFKGCASITSLTMGDEVTQIGGAAFEHCTSLKDVTLSNNLTKLGDFAFYGCKNIGYNVYGNAKYIGSTSNPRLVLVEAQSQDITTCDVHPDTQFICNEAFFDCKSLTDVTIPSGINEISNLTFSGCSSLKNVTLPDSITYVASSLFNGCTSLESLIIPQSVKEIYNGAFKGCTAFKTVYFKGTAEQWAQVKIGNMNNQSVAEATVYFYSESAPSQQGNFWHYDTDGKTAIVWG